MESDGNHRFSNSRLSTPFRVGRFTVHPALNRMTADNRSVRLEPHVMQLLVCLADPAGEAVSREDLFAAVWPNTVVDEDTLTRAMSDLRRAFEDNPRDPCIIETIPKSGYRLIVPVEILTSDSGSETSGQTIGSRAPAKRRPTWGWVVVASAVVIVAAAIWSLWETRVSNRAPLETSLEGTPLTPEPGLESHPTLSPDGKTVLFDSTDIEGDVILVDEYENAANRR